MGEIIASGRLGRVIHINALHYKPWLRQPYEAASFDPLRGGGILYRQGPHQLDIVRYLGGGMVHSVRGVAGRWNPYFDVEGDYSAFMEFENGAVALVCFNGYGHFNGTELTWGIGDGGFVRSDEVLYGPRRKPTRPLTGEEYYAQKEFSTEALRTRRERRPPHQDIFGLTIVSCERGDIRQSPDGIYLYTEDGRSEIVVTDDMKHRGGAEVHELLASIRENRPSFPDEGWGRATLEACVAILESGRKHREVTLKYQVASPVEAPAAAKV
jgi:phthalate 4,5-cis-dihydrodiol dehydrogenase